MNFEKKQSFYLIAGVSSFVFSAGAVFFAIVLILFPDLILAFSDMEAWVYLMTNLRLFVVVWVFISFALQIACGIVFVLPKTEESFNKMKVWRISAIVVTAVFGFFVTLGIIIAEILISHFSASSLPKETLK